MERFNQHMDHLNKVQPSGQTRLPPEVERLLEGIARQGIQPHLVLQHYTTMFTQEHSPGPSHAAQAPAAVLDDLTGSSSSEGHYGCPWCASMIKQEKDFIRHVKEKCCLETEFRCPDCSRTYTRKHRLANHHKAVHPHRCGSGPCTHVHSAAVKLNNAETLGCGFCSQLFHNDLHGFLRHVINHYRGGATLTAWHNGHYVPSPNSGRPFSPPPKIQLRGSLEIQGNTSDFSALRSGFGLQDESPIRADSAISNGSTLFDPMDTAGYAVDHLGTKCNWDPFFNPTNLASFNSVPTTAASQHQPLSFDQQHPHDENFSDIIQYFDDQPGFMNEHFIDTTGDTVVEQSAAVADACAQLSSGMDMEPGPPSYPPFNPTPPLDIGKARRASMSERLLRKFQSLSPLRTEF